MTDGRTDRQTDSHTDTACNKGIQKYASLVLLTRISAVQGIPAPGIGTVLSVYT